MPGLEQIFKEHLLSSHQGTEGSDGGGEGRPGAVFPASRVSSVKTSLGSPRAEEHTEDSGGGPERAIWVIGQIRDEGG